MRFFILSDTWVDRLNKYLNLSLLPLSGFFSRELTSGSGAASQYFSSADTVRLLVQGQQGWVQNEGLHLRIFSFLLGIFKTIFLLLPLSPHHSTGFHIFSCQFMITGLFCSYTPGYFLDYKPNHILSVIEKLLRDEDWPNHYIKHFL